MTGCETAAALPQAAIQRDALSTDEVQHALSMRIATPVVPASPVAVPAAVPVAVPAVKEEEKVEEKEEKKEEEVKETVKEEEKVQTAPEESAEQIHEETSAKAHEENATELTVKTPSGDCCIVMWCPCSTNNGDAATLC